MDKKIKKIPLVTYIYIMSIVYGIFNLITTVSWVTKNNIENFSITPLVISLVFEIAIIAVLFRNKKDIPLFAVFAINSARTIFSTITNFSIFGVLGCVSSLLLTFIIGTAVLPQLSQYQSKAKKLFFIPSIIALVVSIFSSIEQLQNFTLFSPVYLFMICIVPFAKYFFLASWCVKSQEVNSVNSKTETLLFKIIVIILVICIAFSLYMKFGHEKPKESNDSVADYIKENDPDLYSEMEDIYNGVADEYNNKSGSNKDSNGFVGSDGKYYNYVPEFGDDVNNWMADNW